MCHLFDGHIHPQNKLLERAHIVFERMFRAIFSFQKPAVINDGIGNVH
jgi:hypothetical protein